MQRIALIRNDQDYLERLEGEFQTEYNVSLYYSGNSFLEMLRYNCPDVIVIGDDLPDFSGVELLKKFRELSLDVPVVWHTKSAPLQEQLQQIRGEVTAVVQWGADSLYQVITTARRMLVIHAKRELKRPRWQKWLWWRKDI